METDEGVDWLRKGMNKFYDLKMDYVNNGQSQSDDEERMAQ